MWRDANSVATHADKDVGSHQARREIWRECGWRTQADHMCRTIRRRWRLKTEMRRLTLNARSKLGKRPGNILDTPVQDLAQRGYRHW